MRRTEDIKLSGPFGSQTQRNLQSFQQRQDQRQLNQKARESEQQRQQILQQLQNNRLRQRQSRQNRQSGASSLINRQNQGGQMNTQIRSSQIPLLSQQRRQRQQTTMSRDLQKLGLEENSLSSSPWNQELFQGFIQPSSGSFPERTRITNSNQQQLIWQQRRVNNMLRRQKNEKQRVDQLTLQQRQQEDKMERLLLQETQLKQLWKQQRPLIAYNDIIEPASWKSREVATQAVYTSNPVLVNASIQGTTTVTDPTETRVFNQKSPVVVSNRAVLNVGEVLPIVDSGVHKAVGDNLMKTPHFVQEVQQPPPIFNTTEITNNATSNHVITVTGADSTNDIANKTNESFPVAVLSVNNNPFKSSASTTTSGASTATHNAEQLTTIIHPATEAHLLHALLGPLASHALLKENATSSAAKAILQQIHNLMRNSNKIVHFGGDSNNKSIHESGQSNNKSVIPHENRVLFVHNMINAQPETGSVNTSTMLGSETTVSSVSTAEITTEVRNITCDVLTGFNVTTTPPMTRTMIVNVTTTVVTEATEAVPTLPPPPPGFPHMFEALPGQELTEAQLEYNEMREALMAK